MLSRQQPDWFAAIAEEWANHFARAVESMIGEAASARLEGPVATIPEEEGMFWREHAFSLAPGAPLWIGLPAASWQAIGHTALKAVGIDEGADDDVRSTYLELLNRSLSSLAQGLAARLNREVSCQAGKEAARC